MKNLAKDTELFIQKHPDIAKAMEICRVSMADYRRAYGFINDPRTHTSDTTRPSEKAS